MITGWAEPSHGPVREDFAGLFASGQETGAALADSLLILLTNRDYASRMGRAGYARAVGIFGWERFIHTLERVYERVLDENPAVCRTGLRVAA